MVSPSADGDALLAEDGGDTGLGDGEAITNLFSGLTRFIPLHDVGDVLSDQKAF